MSKQKQPLTKAQYKALRDKWYAKLAKTGFEDIEDVNSPRQMLKAWHSSDIPRKARSGGFIAIQDYYSRATEFLNNYIFESKFELKVWTLHADGQSLREIAKQCKCGKDKVRTIVLKLQKESKCRI